MIRVAIPAWGERCVTLAERLAIPAVRASGAAEFIIYTDQPRRFAGHDVRPVPVSAAKRPDWDKFIACHKDALATAPHGSILCLLNADIVVSVETIGYVMGVFADPKINVVASFGIRANSDLGDPPIGETADELMAWTWAHRHRITSELIWGTGRSGLPTQLFFSDGRGNVSTYGFYTVPMFVRIDGRQQGFANTIDDDMLAGYADHEIHYMNDSAAAFCELSPSSKVHSVKPAPMSVQSMVSFGRGRVRPHHIRNFRQGIRVLGETPGRNPVIEQIIAGITRR